MLTPSVVHVSRSPFHAGTAGWLASSYWYRHGPSRVSRRPLLSVICGAQKYTQMDPHTVHSERQPLSPSRRSIRTTAGTSDATQDAACRCAVEAGLAACEFGSSAASGARQISRRQEHVRDHVPSPSLPHCGSAPLVLQSSLWKNSDSVGRALR
jgi:hypothetical protein